MFTRDWIMCSKFVIYPKFNVQHNWGGMGPITYLYGSL